MFDLVEHVPIKSSNDKVLPLRQLALDTVRARAKKLGCVIAGGFSFRVIELPLSTYLECRVPVETPAMETLILDQMRRGRI